jgi:DNA-binding IclR family transcriptional regulator
MFDDGHLVISAAEVVELLGVARSTAYRYLQSLVQSQFLEEADGRGYRLGRRVLELARIARRGMGLSEIARPVMMRLAAQVGEAVLLTRLAGSTVICLEREDAGTRVVRISYERGQVLPTNAGASAHALLAWLPEATAEAILDSVSLPAFTDRTLTDKHAIMRRLAETREQGYSISRGELDHDVLGVAAPLRNHDGDVVGAISIAAVSARVPDERLPEVTQDVCKAAEEISATLALLDLVPPCSAPSCEPACGDGNRTGARTATVSGSRPRVRIQAQFTYSEGPAGVRGYRRVAAREAGYE